MAMIATARKRNALVALLSCIVVPAALADTTPHSLQLGPFSQNWSNGALITVNNDWSAVPSVLGIRGDDLTTVTGTDPQTIVAEQATVNVIANQSNTSNTTGGVAEFDGIANPCVALQGSGTADAPYVQISLNTTSLSTIAVTYNLRDIDATTDNAVTPVALQFRVGSTGNFTNVPAGFVADATTGPSLAGLTTAVFAVLPAAADNQPVVQVRIITTNAAGNDEWVGIDDMVIAPWQITGVGGAIPSIVAAGGSTLLTVAVTPGLAPPSTGIAVNVDLSAIGGLALQTFFDDGTNGDVTAGDNVFSFTAAVPAETSPGAKSLPVTITDAQSRSASPSIALTVQQPIAVTSVSWTAAKALYR